MRIKLIIISIILLFVIVFASGCSQFMENIGLLSPADEEQLSPEKGGPPDGLVKVLIGFKEKPGAAQQAMVQGVGGQIKYTYNIVDAIAALIPEKAIEALQKNPNVTHVELDSMVYALDTELDNSWGVDRIDAEEVWTGNNMGQDVKVAIIDSGIDGDHPELEANIGGGVNFVSTPSWKTPDPDKWDDDYGHGTHVAGIVAALDNGSGVVGVAPGADLYALKVLDRKGRGYVSDVIAAIDWSVINDMQVINMSLGGGEDEDLEIACSSAYESGLILVAAAGNKYGGSVIYPAAYSSVIAVSATNNSDDLASFSSVGYEVELAAPGVDIYSTYKDGGYATYSGTSMAAPHVAGVAALMIVANVPDIIDKLQVTAEDLGDLGKDEMYGYGLVDAENAVLGTTDGDDLFPTATGTISGTVTDAGTGLPIDEGLVTANGHSTSTDADGIYTLADLPVDSYTVTASAEGYNSVSQGATVEADSITTVDFILGKITEESQELKVNSIEMWYKSAGPNRFVSTKVEIVSSDSTAVSGATVYLETTLPDNSKVSGSGDTADDGTITFEIKSRQTGTYTSIVTNVEKDGWKYDPSGETSDSITF